MPWIISGHRGDEPACTAGSAPGQWNVDFSFGKTVPLKERVLLRVRADLFNALNHTNPTGLETNISSARFGRLTSTTGATDTVAGAAELLGRLTRGELYLSEARGH